MGLTHLIEQAFSYESLLKARVKILSSLLICNRRIQCHSFTKIVRMKMIVLEFTRTDNTP